MSPAIPSRRWLEDYARVERAIRYLETHAPLQPSSRELARALHLSESHLHHLFRRWAGIGPKRFLEAVTLRHAKALLAESRSVLDAALGAGLSGPGRLHDLFVHLDAVTPGEFKRRGEGMRIVWGFHATPVGEALVAARPRGVCHLSFVTSSRSGSLRALRGQWPGAELAEDAGATAPIIARAFAERRAASDRPLSLLVAGTNFQIKVWEALLRIPAGGVATYGQVARHLGRPHSTRAVGQAVGANPIAYLIPCHRVLRESAAVGGYRWGETRKRALLAREAALSDEEREATAGIQRALDDRAAGRGGPLREINERRSRRV